MAKPLPPVVYGPITPASTQVQVTGILPNSTVNLLADSTTPVGQTTSSAPGTVSVPLTKTLQVGQKVSATQTYNGGSSSVGNVQIGSVSDPSNQAVPVIAVPNPPAAPVFISALSTCVDNVLLDALIPGATVTITMNGQTVAKTKAGHQTDWFAIAPNTGPLPENATLEATQEIVLGAQTLNSATTTSLPLTPIGLDRLDPPSITEPLLSCQTSLRFFNMIPSADVTVDNQGVTSLWTNPAQAYNGIGVPPLKVPTLTANQRFPRCKVEGRVATFQVTAAPPPLPTVRYAPCADTKQLTVSNLVAGEVLAVLRVVHQGQAESITPLGSMGVSADPDTVTLPPDFKSTDPLGPVSIWLEPNLCGLEPTPNFVDIALAAAGGPYPAPFLDKQLFDCARYVRIHGAHPGSLIQVLSDRTLIPRCNAVVAAASDVVIKLWTPLVVNEVILIRQFGCNADGDSVPMKVSEIPKPLPAPQISGPVRPSASSIQVDKVIPGAQIYLFVNDGVRSVVDSCLNTTCFLPAGSPALVQGDQLKSAQALCNQISQLDKATTQVTVGTMKVTVNPSTAQRDSLTSVTVTASDADTAQPVAGADVLLNGTKVGVTGVAFPYAPAHGTPNPAGTVHAPPAYSDASFTINLIDAPLGVLTLKLGSLQLPTALHITSVDWTVTPFWASPALNLHGQTVSSPLPAPPNPQGSQFAVAGTINLRLNGDINGVTYPDQNFSAPINQATFVWKGQNLGLGWLLVWNQIVDQNGNYYIQVQANLIGPQ
jgi:hypothetical protein